MLYRGKIDPKNYYHKNNNQKKQKTPQRNKSKEIITNKGQKNTTYSFHSLGTANINALEPMVFSIHFRTGNRQ